MDQISRGRPPSIPEASKPSSLVSIRFPCWPRSRMNCCGGAVDAEPEFAPKLYMRSHCTDCSKASIFHAFTSRILQSSLSAIPHYSKTYDELTTPNILPPRDTEYDYHNRAGLPKAALTSSLEISFGQVAASARLNLLTSPQ